METIMTVGDILKDCESLNLYRVISISDTETILCAMNTKNFILSAHDTYVLIRLILDKEIVKEIEEDVIFHFAVLPEKAKISYEKKKRVVSEVINTYRHDFMELYGKGQKSELKEILNKYSVPINSFWRFFTKYMQSGMKDFSLVDARYLGFNKGKKYNYNAKPGQKSEYFESTGLIITDAIKGYFDEALKEFRSGRQMSFKACYDWMNALHFTKTEIINGVRASSIKMESISSTIQKAKSRCTFWLGSICMLSRR